MLWEKREAALAIARAGKWSDELLLRSHAWDAHCRRGSGDTPTARFLGLGRLALLQQLRAAFIFSHGTQGDSIGIGAGRFGLRAGRGRPAARWEEAIERSKERYTQLLQDRRDCKMRPKSRRTPIAAGSRKDIATEME